MDDPGRMTPLVELGYKLLLGETTPRLPLHLAEDATHAAHLHMQYHEIDRARLMQQVAERRAREGQPHG